MSYETNPYYHPEVHGLTIVGSVDCDGDYGFDMFVVWTDGKALYWGQDSGCSCPSPFEDANTLGDLCSGSRKECLRAIDAWAFEEYHSNLHEVPPLKAAVESWRAAR